MTPTDRAISDFWRVFQRHKDGLESLSSADNPTYDIVLEQLQHIHPRLYFEFSSNPGASELIITADGDRSLFDLVDSIVSASPVIRGWVVFALKPKHGFPVAVTWEGVRVRIADIVFEALETERSKDLFIRMYVPGIASETADDAHNALLRALDHALGEREFAEAVQGTEVFRLPDDAAKDDYIPLTDLEAFINWRKGRQTPNVEH